MKVQFTSEPDVYEVSGQELRIHWDITEVTREDMEGNPETFWQASEALCRVSDVRNVLIEKIMATQYTTGAELAAINNGGEDYETYQAFRVQAKALADGWIGR